jgi:sporulation protein YlmC with PRC-barrel domain
MAHYGSLGDHRFTAHVPDVRGADVYGSEDEKIGNIEDVIFDHETMEIRFVVIEGGDSSQSHKFLFPVNRIFDDNQHRYGFAIGITKVKTFRTSTKDRSSRRKAGRSIWTNSRSSGKRTP